MTQDLRKAFLDFFKRQGHTIVPSDSLVPSSDPSLLFTSAGMVQFKAHFLQQIPLTFTRAASSQRCLRTTDIERVGLTARHLTFFEMLGNFSFGDYFKEEAIAWAWEFLTKEVGLSKDRLWISIYKNDEEALQIWQKHVPESKIVRMGDDANFWTMGPTGPCGPCSEIYFDKEGGDGPGPRETDDTDRYMEVWNNVFTQFDRQEDGSLVPLPKKNIDTGMGLERLASVVEGVKANFDTSLLRPLIGFAEESLKQKYGVDEKKDVSMRIVADHLRAVTFLVFDGILPSNEGRGYVLRRLLRRATRQGTLFGAGKPFLHEGVKLVSELMKSTAPDLPGRVDTISNIIREEEERFLETVGTGSERLKELVGAAKSARRKSLTGAEVFRLYDTYGFPPDLTREMLAENGLSFDDKEFQTAQNAAQETASQGWKGSGAKDVTIYNELQKKNGLSVFRGYDTLSVTSPIVAILKNGKPVTALVAGEHGEVMAKESPFYPEGGGQVGDKGWIFRAGSNEAVADVIDTQKPIPDFISHHVVAKRELKVGDALEFRVDKNTRNPTRRHHTATHILHAALRTVLGKTVTQAGSLVAPDRLRFDYTFNKPLTHEQILEIENIVNNAVLENYDVTPKEFSAADAKKMGAMALFGEKYGDKVRCLLISAKGYDDHAEGFSLELCGGTHVDATGDIGAFKIVSDTSLAAGIRRMEAVAGMRAIEYFRQTEGRLNTIADKLKAPPAEADARVTKLLDRQRQLEQEVRDLKLRQAQAPSAAGAAGGPSVQTVNGIQLAVNVTEGLDPKDLRTLADRLKQQIKSGVVFAATVINDEGRKKVSFVFAITDDVKAKGVDAGKLAKAAAVELQGSGGGRADFAQGGGEGRDRLDALVKKLPEFLK